MGSASLVWWVGWVEFTCLYSVRFGPCVVFIVTSLTVSFIIGGVATTVMKKIARTEVEQRVREVLETKCQVRIFGVEFMSATHHGSPSKVLDGKLHVPSDAIILFSRTATSRIADISLVPELLVAL